MNDGAAGAARSGWRRWCYRRGWCRRSDRRWHLYALGLWHRGGLRNRGRLRRQRRLAVIAGSAGIQASQPARAGLGNWLGASTWKIVGSGDTPGSGTA